MNVSDKNIKLLVIDLFCGAGGTTTGIEAATDKNGNKIAKTIACVNHDQLAIESHKANHPDCLHFIEDIRQLGLDRLIEHKNRMLGKYRGAKVKLHASLECTHFSNAKGGDSRDEDSRSLALDMPRYIKALNPDFFTIENVKEFMSWGEMSQRYCKKQGWQIIRDRKKAYFDIPFKGNESKYKAENIKARFIP